LILFKEEVFMQLSPIKKNNIIFENIITSKEIKGKKEITILKKKVEEWQKIAEKKLKSYPIESQERQISQDCVSEAQAIRRQLSVIKKDKLSVFAAYDQNKKIQGIAIARIPKTKYASEIDNMVVNPESIKLIGKKPVQGTGTSLVKKIAARILNNAKGRKELRAWALHAAIPFYEKLGFKFDVKNGGGCPYAEAMVLTQRCMKKLMQNP
jgi:hypothetical protein